MVAACGIDARTPIPQSAVRNPHSLLDSHP
jgi:hypothetical protein